MNDVLPVAGAFAVGMLLGLFFFAGLLWTVRKGVVSAHPVLWFAGSLLLRTGVVLLGFFFVGRGHWQRLLICLAGFILSRMLVMRLSRLTETSSTLSKQEPPHAS